MLLRNAVCFGHNRKAYFRQCLLLICTSVVEDFIKAIDAIYKAQLPKYSSKMREIYVENYSPEKAEITLREIMGV